MHVTVHVTVANEDALIRVFLSINHHHCSDVEGSCIAYFIRSYVDKVYRNCDTIHVFCILSSTNRCEFSLPPWQYNIFYFTLSFIV